MCKRIWHIAIIVVLGFLFCDLWFRDSYWNKIIPDVCFLIVEPWRFTQGDLPILHEWHLSMFYGVMAMPLLKFREWLCPDLNIFRYASKCFLILWVISMYVIWRRWRFWSDGWAFLGVMAVAFYPPWGGWGFGYNQFGTLFMMLAITFYATAREHQVRDLFIAGVFLALAVLNCPYLVLLYVLYAAYAVFKDRRGLVCLTTGCACVGGAVLIWLFSQLTISDVVKSWPGLMGDPEHAPRSFLILIRDFVGHLFFITHDYAWGHAALISLSGLSILLALVDKNRSRHLPLHLSTILCAVLGLFAYYRIQPLVCRNPLMMPVPILALWSVAMCWKETDMREIFIKAVFPGLVYVFAISCASNMGLYSMSFAAETVLVISGVVFGLVARRLGRAFCIAVLGVMAVHFGLVFETQKFLFRTFASRPGYRMMTKGPARGINFRNDIADMYEELYRDSAAMRENPSVKTVLYFDHVNQWMYMASEKKMGVFSSWLSGTGTNTVNRLGQFWEVNPDRVPDAIFITKENRGKEQLFCDRYGYEVQALTSGHSILWRKGFR